MESLFDSKSISSLISNLGFPIVVCLYLFYYIRQQGKTLEKINGVLIHMSTQITSVLSAAIMYKNEDKVAGDLFAQQAISTGNHVANNHSDKETGGE